MLFTIALAACGGGGPTGDGPGSAAAGDTSGGDDLAAYEGPISCAEGGADGAETYTTMCNGCHSGYAPTLANLSWSAAQMRRQIVVGSDTMPGFGEDRLSAGDLECLMSHLESIGSVAGAAPAEADAPIEAGVSVAG